MSDGFYRRAVIGGVISVAASAVPFVGPLAPAVGGGIAAWLAAGTDDDGAMLGAAAGLVGAVIALPVILLTAVLALGVSTATVVTLPLFLLVMGTYAVSLGAAGGFAGEYLSPGDARSTPDPEQSDAVDRLKERYVAGEVTEAEFERRLERLIDEDERPDADLADRETTTVLERA